MNGSQREGCKRLLAKVNGVDAQVQQEAPPSPFFLADSLAAVPQAEFSLLCLFLKVNEFLPFLRRESKRNSRSVSGRTYLRCCGYIVTLAPTGYDAGRRRRGEDLLSQRGVSPSSAVVVLLLFRFSTGWPLLLLVP